MVLWEKHPFEYCKAMVLLLRRATYRSILRLLLTGAARSRAGIAAPRRSRRRATEKLSLLVEISLWKSIRQRSQKSGPPIPVCRRRVRIRIRNQNPNPILTHSAMSQMSPMTRALLKSKVGRLISCGFMPLMCQGLYIYRVKTKGIVLGFQSRPPSNGRHLRDASHHTFGQRDILFDSLAYRQTSKSNSQDAPASQNTKISKPANSSQTKKVIKAKAPTAAKVATDEADVIASRARCIKCLADHGTTACTRNKDRDGPPACVLCKSAGHIANYLGCPRAPKRKPTQINNNKKASPSFQTAPRRALARVVTDTLSYAKATTVSHNNPPTNSPPITSSSEDVKARCRCR
ncbi:hypothetical protein EVAR_30938_1 [Eumeta japonica]|uniref:Nucleic-acid-binding protein from transposon X-element n=1 Tax=Eumeta variegata TaxID=151549 RepID=A0A4C1V3G8_EUMVA|nr:hypothetical protein EVAR_30938_1 [Eumeta japonica]